MNLRHRLIAMLAIVTVLQIGVAVFVISTTRAQLVRQVDDRLTLVADTAADNTRRDAPDLGNPEVGESDGDGPGTRDGGAARPERPEDVYEGTLSADGVLTTRFAAERSGRELPPPVLDAAAARASEGRPVTVANGSGDFGYRVVATPSGDGFIVLGLPLDDVDDTISVLTTRVGAAFFTLIAVLAVAVALVIRSGIVPLVRMTERAESIAKGDLSIRVDAVEGSTEAAKLGSTLNEMMSRIEQSFDGQRVAEERLRQFLADAAHELRTPVATIRGYAEMYRTGGLDDPNDLADAMRRSEQESLRMSRLIGDMLLLARMDAQPSISVERIDVDEFVSDVVTNARVRHPDRTIDLEASPGFVLEADPDMVAQMLTNVIDNAVVHAGDEAVVRVESTLDADWLVLRVSDDGCGMSADALSKLTTRFYRVDSARSRKKGGSGLGLSIVDVMVSAHGGELSFESEVGVGTSVVIRLPIRHDAGRRDVSLP